MRSRLVLFLPALVGLLLVDLLFGEGAAAARAPHPAPRRVGWWLARHAAQNQPPGRAEARLIFVGDSITAGWLGAGLDAWTRSFGRYRPLNLGISGDRTRHLLWRLQHGALDGLPRARLVVLLIGINDLAFYGAPVRDVVDGILACALELRARLPGARVLLLGLLPSGLRRGPLRDRIARVNRWLEQAAGDAAIKATDVRYLDVGPRLLDANGVLRSEVSPDSLHLSGEGYRRWAEGLTPIIVPFLEER